VKDLSAGADGERWSFFLVEGAETLQILPSTGQADMLPDNLGDVDPILDLIDDIVRNQASTHGRRSSSLPQTRWGWYA
jgi:hypothetical protein